MTETAREDLVVTCTSDRNPNVGVRLTFAPDGKVERYVELINGIPDGKAQRFSRTGEVIEEGNFRDGLRSGEWTEWTGDRFTRGTYSKGMRVGLWEVVQSREQSLPDYEVSFERGAPMGAERAIEKYQIPMAIADGATLALALYGYAKDRPGLTIAGSDSFMAAGPLGHAWQQHDGERGKAALKSLQLRPLVLGGAFALYTMGKFFDAFECHDSGEGTEDGGPDIGCDDITFDFNTHYNFPALLIVAAVGVLAADISEAKRSKISTVMEAWPQLSIEPTNGGATMSIGGNL